MKKVLLIIVGVVFGIPVLLTLLVAVGQAITTPPETRDSIRAMTDSIAAAKQAEVQAAQEARAARGDWQTGQFVDEFGDASGQKYMKMEIKNVSSTHLNLQFWNTVNSKRTFAPSKYAWPGASPGDCIHIRYHTRHTQVH